MNEEMQAQATLFAKLARVMGKVRTLPKTGYNQHFKYHFVTDGTVSEAISNALAAENVAFIPSILESRNDGKITHTRFLFTFCCGDTGAIFQAAWEGEGLDNQDKGVSKSATSAVKYFLLKTFLIDTGEKTDDPDNDTALDKKPGKQGNAQPKTEQQRTTQPAATPVAFDAASGPAFVEWATGQFPDLSPSGLNEALQRVVPNLEFIQQWPMSVNEAIGAIMAYQAEYDAPTLKQWFINLKKSPILKNSRGDLFNDAQLDTFRSMAMKFASNVNNSVTRG